MKRLAFVSFIIAFLLVACGEDELKDFTRAYNSVAEKYDVPTLDTSEFKDIEEEEFMSWQSLYESRNYNIDAKYKDGKNLSGYHIAMAYEQPYSEQKGMAYNSSVAIAEALDLNIASYVKEFETALTLGSHSYKDEDYLISFTNAGEDSLTSIGMIINFDKN